MRQRATGAMTKLVDDEEITLQIIAIPVKLREAAILSHRILGNENILQQVGSKKLPFIGTFGSAFGKAAMSATDLLSLMRGFEAGSRVVTIYDLTTHSRRSILLHIVSLCVIINSNEP